MITAAEIIILIAGAVLITASFIVPDKSSNDLFDSTLNVDDEAVRSIVDDEVRKAKESIDEAAKLSISDSKDKLERYMDRLTNEKMMAVNEYSDTVIQQIHKDHEEAVFLYDMIDNKHSQVKNTAAELGQLEKDVKRLAESIPKAAPIIKATEDKPAETKASMPDSNSAAVPEAYTDTDSDMPQAVDETENKADEAVQDDRFTALTPETVSIPEEIVSDGPIGNEGVELMFDSDSNSMNNNDRILALHKEGKSNMAIAKELGLGVGEVKLVIDLFKS